MGLHSYSPPKPNGKLLSWLLGFWGALFRDLTCLTSLDQFQHSMKSPWHWRDRWSMNLWYIRMKIYDSSTILWYSTIHDSEWVHFHGLTTVFSLWCSRLWVWKFVKDNAFLSGFGKPSWLHIWQAHTRPFAILVAVSMVVNLMTQITSSVWTKHMLYMWAISALFQSREPISSWPTMMDRWLFFCKKHQFIPERSDDSITQSTARCKSHSHVTRNERPRLAENDDRLTTTGEILWGRNFWQPFNLVRSC